MIATSLLIPAWGSGKARRHKSQQRLPSDREDARRRSPRQLSASRRIPFKGESTGKKKKKKNIGAVQPRRRWSPTTMSARDARAGRATAIMSDLTAPNEPPPRTRASANDVNDSELGEVHSMTR